MKPRITGIQQLGVGVPDVVEGWKWYNRNFGMDVKIFDEEAVAQFMLPHTGGLPRERRAMLVINMRGGGGMEIWQHTGKTPQMPSFQIQLGDLGICAGKMRTDDIQRTYRDFQEKKLSFLTPVTKDPSGNPHFYVKDLYDNVWEFVQEGYIFDGRKGTNGGVLGATIGVKDVEESLKVYRDILGYTKTIYDTKGVFEDLSGVPGGECTMRRVLIANDFPDQGPFSPLFGPSQIELVQVEGREPRTIFEGRIWGDPGFIQVCYDIVDMDALREFTKENGFPFTVDSSKSVADFDMGEAGGNFSYIQCPESTLIEFVETTMVPIVKKIGLVINLKGKKSKKPLPRLILKALALKREKI